MYSKISHFYKNKNILLTGGTGFLGLGLVEKILRCFPDIGNIYMLVRSKRGKSIEERKVNYLKNEVFNRVYKENQADFSKIQWIEGDMNKANLGLDQRTIKLLQENVNMIINSAASVRFTEPLKDAINTNVIATNDLLKIASGCENFNCFIQISTLYSNARKSVKFIDETIHEHPVDPTFLMHIANTHTRDQLTQKTNEFILDWPNTYTYTKNASENLVANFKDCFPIAIFRPAVVVHSYNEPYPCWIGKNMAFARILMESHRGLVLDAKPHVNGHCVPVDLTINAILATAYKTALNGSLDIVNFSTQDNPMEYSKIFDIYTKTINNYKSVLVPKRQSLLNMKDIQKGSKKDKMLKEIQEYNEFHETARYFLHTHFDCSTTNINKMLENMSNEDKKLLAYDIRDIDWVKFYSNLYHNAYGTKRVQFDD